MFNVISCTDEGLPFISRTGKTSDMTKIKGWKSKFVKSKETSLSSDGADGLSCFNGRVHFYHCVINIVILIT